MKLWFVLVVRREHRRAGARPPPLPPRRRSSVTPADREFYRGRRVMITGGLGFIGSNLARCLVAAGADILIVDAFNPGVRRQSLQPRRASSRSSASTSPTCATRRRWTRWCRTARSSSTSPGRSATSTACATRYTDLEINCRAQLSMLEACRRHNPSVRVVYAGTRQVYGRPDRLPVDEPHLVRPADINGVNKAAGEYYHLLYNNVFGVRACSLRLTNVYGPRQLIKHNRQGFIGWFIRLAIEGREIQVFGDGSQLRDFVYVDDAADAFLRAGATDACDGEVFNVGGDRADQPSRSGGAAARDGGIGHRCATSTGRRTRSGSTSAASTPTRRSSANTVGWRPAVDLREGLRRTVEFYREHMRPLRRPPPVAERCRR